MQIFFVDEDPIIAAQMLCDKHITSQTKEAGQILATIHHRHGDKVSIKPYPSRHPVIAWAGESIENYRWTVAHAIELAREKTKRFGGIHAYTNFFAWCKEHEPPIPDLGLTFPHVPKGYDPEDPVNSFRDYYVLEKSYFAKWRMGNVPDWFPKE